jgi:uncharacterized phage protein (TIGR01671 family)
MRDLKFRVWNGYEMVYNVTVGKFGTFYVNPGDNGDGLDPKDSACLTSFTKKFSDDIPIMQYIGLKDRNSVEIYEGDLYYCHDYKDDIYQVMFVSGSFVGGKSEGSCMPLGWEELSIDNPSNWCTVIGNIYETPQLLNKTA